MVYKRLISVAAALCALKVCLAADTLVVDDEREWVYLDAEHVLNSHRIWEDVDRSKRLDNEGSTERRKSYALHGIDDDLLHRMANHTYEDGVTHANVFEDHHSGDGFVEICVSFSS